MKAIRVFFFSCLLFPTISLAAGFKVTSTTLKEGKAIGNDHVLNDFGCSGKNISPDLEWSGAPAGTKSFAISIYDPDVKTGSGWWHWVVFNIPASATKIPANAGNLEANLMPQGAVQSRTDFGKSGFGGPCPPAGDKPHRYQVKVFALKDMLPLDKDASGAMVGFYIQQMKLGEATLTAKYGR